MVPAPALLLLPFAFFLVSSALLPAARRGYKALYAFASLLSPLSAFHHPLRLSDWPDVGDVCGMGMGYMSGSGMAGSPVQICRYVW